MPESFSKIIKAINTTSLQRGWLTATTTVPKERNFNEAFDDAIVLAKALKVHPSVILFSDYDMDKAR